MKTHITRRKAMTESVGAFEAAHRDPFEYPDGLDQMFGPRGSGPYRVHTPKKEDPKPKGFDHTQFSRRKRR